MVPFERAMVISYRLSIVTIPVSLTIRSQFAVECLRRLNQLWWVTLGQNLARNGLTDVSHILTQSGRDTSCCTYAKEIVSIASAV